MSGPSFAASRFHIPPEDKREHFIDDYSRFLMPVNKLGMMFPGEWGWG